MAEMTPWGYEVDDLPPIVSVADFKAMTSMNLCSTDDVLLAKLNAASAAVRSWCHWHVAPNIPCTWTGEPQGAFIQMPVMGVTSVDRVSVRGNELDRTEYEWMGAGLIRTHAILISAWRGITVNFHAGYSSADDVVQVVVQLTENALAATPGIREEHADGVGVTYNSTGSGVTGGVRLLPSDKETLAHYRLAGV